MSKRFPSGSASMVRAAPAINAEAPDLWPTCPKCGDLARPDRLTCAACGTRLYPRVTA